MWNIQFAIVCHNYQHFIGVYDYYFKYFIASLHLSADFQSINRNRQSSFHLLFLFGAVAFICLCGFPLNLPRTACIQHDKHSIRGQAKAKFEGIPMHTIKLVLFRGTRKIQQTV